MGSVLEPLNKIAGLKVLGVVGLAALKAKKRGDDKGLRALRCSMGGGTSNAKTSIRARWCVSGSADA